VKEVVRGIKRSCPLLSLPRLSSPLFLSFLSSTTVRHQSSNQSSQYPCPLYSLTRILHLQGTRPSNGGPLTYRIRYTVDNRR
jgi:hypothetical protein